MKLASVAPGELIEMVLASLEAVPMAGDKKPVVDLTIEEEVKMTLRDYRDRLVVTGQPYQSFDSENGYGRTWGMVSSRDETCIEVTHSHRLIKVVEHIREGGYVDYSGVGAGAGGEGETENTYFAIEE